VISPLLFIVHPFVTTLRKTQLERKRMTVLPTYGYVSLALVNYSNEGGPGPRYNMKEVPGFSTLIMLVVHAYPMPLFSEAGDQETSCVGLPPIRATLARPPPAPFKYILHPLQR
jgi:hypothetical protein